jgi:hypothetical protein
MPPETKLSRRFSHRTPHARCLAPDCPFTRNGRLAALTADVAAHVEDTAHRVEVIESASVIYARQAQR